MKTCTILLALFSLFSAVSFARADLVTAIDVTADFYSGNHYAIGFDLDSNNLINRVYFQDQNGNKTFWTLGDLSNFQPVFTIAGFNVVQMRIASHVGNASAVIELQYTKDSLSGSTQTLQFQCRLDAATGKYEVVDNRTGKIIHNVEATTHYSFLHIPVGIDSILTN